MSSYLMPQSAAVIISPPPLILSGTPQPPQIGIPTVDTPPTRGMSKRQAGNKDFVGFDGIDLDSALDFIFGPELLIRWIIVNALLTAGRIALVLSTGFIYNVLLGSSSGADQEALERFDFYFNSQNFVTGLIYNLAFYMFWGIGRVVFSLLVYGPQITFDAVRRTDLGDTFSKLFTGESVAINTAIHIVEGSGAPLAWLAAGAGYKALFGESGGKRRRRRRGDEGGAIGGGLLEAIFSEDFERIVEKLERRREKSEIEI